METALNLLVHTDEAYYTPYSPHISSKLPSFTPLEATFQVNAFTDHSVSFPLDLLTQPRFIAIFWAHRMTRAGLGPGYWL